MTSLSFSISGAAPARTSSQQTSENVNVPEKNLGLALDYASSDSEHEQQAARLVTSFSACDASAPERPLTPKIESRVRSDGGSQIARLVERRRRLVNLGKKGNAVDTEKEAYELDLQECGDEDDKEGYQRMPVEKFGEALLRAMGWNGKRQETEEKPKKPRPWALGLGAVKKEASPIRPGMRTESASKRKEASQKDSEGKINGNLKVMGTGTDVARMSPTFGDMRDEDNRLESNGFIATKRENENMLEQEVSIRKDDILRRHNRDGNKVFDNTERGSIQDLESYAEREKRSGSRSGPESIQKYARKRNRSPSDTREEKRLRAWHKDDSEDADTQKRSRYRDTQDREDSRYYYREHRKSYRRYRDRREREGDREEYEYSSKRERGERQKERYKYYRKHSPRRGDDPNQDKSPSRYEESRRRARRIRGGRCERRESADY